MRRGALAVPLVCALIGVACGAPPSPGSPVAAQTATAAPTTVATSSPTASPSPSPRPPPLSSAKGAITVREPLSGDQVSSPVVISGDASVFEATLRYRVITSVGKVLAEGTTTASAGAPQKGTFRVEVKYETPLYGEPGFVEVFERSPKDGAISEIVRVPIQVLGTY